MALQRYGVLAGTLEGHHRDQPDTQGRWFHVNLRVAALLGSYRCAVDVDSKQSTTGVEWKVLTVPRSALGPVLDVPDGYHDLERSPSSGAIDHIRHPALAEAAGCPFLTRPPPWVERFLVLLAEARAWRSGSNLEAAAAFEPILVVGRRIWVFGEPFRQGLGMHNIHQNQGDPPGSQWWRENGIWQDGATVIERPDGAIDVFLSRFSTQASRTDDDGHPVMSLGATSRR